MMKVALAQHASEGAVKYQAPIFWKPGREREDTMEEKEG